VNGQSFLDRRDQHFGANLPNLADYGIEDRIFELSRVGGALAREVTDEFAEKDRPRFVLGSVGPGIPAWLRKVICVA
jgi:methionine synthase I (cobalamin-dependent)